MGASTFDSTLHHIGLKQFDDLNPARGFLIAGSYMRAFKRQVQSEFQGVTYGTGESLINKPGVSSWTQDDFTGGEFQYVWGKDPAMFARSSNILPSQFDRSLRSVPPLRVWMDNAPPSAFNGTEVPGIVFVYSGFLYAGYSDRYTRWNLTTGAQQSDVLGTLGTEHHWAFLKERGRVYSTHDGVINQYNLNGFPTGVYEGSYAPATYIPALSAFGNATGISVDGDRMAVAYSDVLWVVAIPDTRTAQPARADWTRIGRLPGKWVASCWPSGLLYVLCSGTDGQTSVVAFDGTQILPITDLPYNFVGESIISYGGRVYVGGSGRDIQTSAPRYAELYEITGTSLRLLKTFVDEARGGGDIVGKSITSMAVHEGMLFFGLKGVGLCAYDLTLDAFYGASIFNPADAAAEVRQLVSGRDSLFAYIYPWAAIVNKGVWMRPSTGQETTPVYGSEIETSDFAMSFDRLKSWRQLRCLVRFPQNALAADYSVDGGNSWAALPAPTSESSGRFRLDTFDLTSVPKSRMVRFKFKMDSQTNVTQFREFVAFTASFRLLDSDSVGSGETEKLAWTFVIHAADSAQALDGSTIDQDVLDIHKTLWDWATKRTKLAFTDTDGTNYTVEIDDLRETVPFVLPPDPDPDRVLTDPLTRSTYYQTTLVES